LTLIIVSVKCTFVCVCHTFVVGLE
jgi:hypothetical protein